MRNKLGERSPSLPSPHASPSSDDAILAAADGQTILILEDDDDLAVMLEFALMKAGYRAVRARNGQEGLHEAERRTPEAVLLDLHMPVMDGRAFASAFRQAYGPDIPIIVVTAAADAQAVAAAIGAQAWVEKPIKMHQLFRLLKELVCGAAGHLMTSRAGQPRQRSSQPG